MTNREKFKEVFGFNLDYSDDYYILPIKICDKYDNCEKCPYTNWFNQEYKEINKEENK